MAFLQAVKSEPPPSSRQHSNTKRIQGPDKAETGSCQSSDGAGGQKAEPKPNTDLTVMPQDPRIQKHCGFLVRPGEASALPARGRPGNDGLSSPSPWHDPGNDGLSSPSPWHDPGPILLCSGGSTTTPFLSTGGGEEAGHLPALPATVLSDPASRCRGF